MAEEKNLKMGRINEMPNITGAQIGLVNLSSDIVGVQIGLINSIAHPDNSGKYTDLRSINIGINYSNGREDDE